LLDVVVVVIVVVVLVGVEVCEARPASYGGAMPPAAVSAEPMHYEWNALRCCR
jgi:hypothetical protein